MITHDPMELLDEYATASSRKDPPAQLNYLEGWKIGWKLPDHWWNWLISKLIGNDNKAKAAIDDIYTEMKNALDELDIAPNDTLQFLSSLTSLLHGDQVTSMDVSKPHIEIVFRTTSYTLPTMNPIYKGAYIFNTGTAAITINSIILQPADMLIIVPGPVDWLLYPIRKSSLEATPNTLVLRDINGRAQIADPVAEDDMANKRTKTDTFRATSITADGILPINKMVGIVKPGLTMTLPSSVEGGNYLMINALESFTLNSPVSLIRKSKFSYDDTLLSLNYSKLPEIPDDPDGVTYLNRYFIDADGWSPIRCTLSFSNGKMIVTATDANPGVSRSIVGLDNQNIRAKVKKISGNATSSRAYSIINGLAGPERFVPYADTNEHINYINFGDLGGAPASSYIYPGFTGSAAGDVYEISFIYIGTAEYLPRHQAITPFLHMTYDDLPEIPDDPDGVTYLNDNFTDADGWSTVRCTLSYSDGKMIVTATDIFPTIYRAVTGYEGKQIRVKIKKISSAATNSFLSHDTDPVVSNTQDYDGKTEHIHDFYIVAGATANIRIVPGYTGSAAGDVYEISFIYIGTGEYLPRKDATGNHLIKTVGSVPVPGVSGNGIARDGVCAYEKTVDAVPMPDVFTFSQWIKDSEHTGSAQYFFHTTGITKQLALLRSASESSGFGLIYNDGVSSVYKYLGDIFTDSDLFSITFDIPNETADVYQNGVLVETVSLEGIQKPDAAPWYFGSTSTPAGFATGTFDEMKIFIGALDADQHAFLYENPDGLGEPLDESPYHRDIKVTGSVPIGEGRIARDGVCAYEQTVDAIPMPDKFTFEQLVSITDATDYKTIFATNDDRLFLQASEISAPNKRLFIRLNDGTAKNYAFDDYFELNQDTLVTVSVEWTNPGAVVKIYKNKVLFGSLTDTGALKPATLPWKFGQRGDITYIEGIFTGPGIYAGLLEDMNLQVERGTKLTMQYDDVTDKWYAFEEE